MTRTFESQRGYFTFVQNSDTVDYLSLAYLQALSIKLTQRHNKYAVCVDAETRAQLTHKHLCVFDHVLDIPGNDDAQNQSWKLANEWKAWHVTPFKETVKLDCDVLFVQNHDHWWNSFVAQEVVVSVGARDITGNISNSRAYRKLFDANSLPDAYSAYTYFRYSRTSADFFKIVRDVFENWENYKDLVLRECVDEHATTDVAYAIAAMTIGTEKTTLPTLDYPNIVHMKPKINKFPVGTSWTDNYVWSIDNTGRMIIDGRLQQYPVHLVDKNFATKELIQRYEQLLGIT